MKVLVFFVSYLSVVCGTRILCFFPFPSISHQKVFRPIWEGLAKENHEVTVITPDPTFSRSSNIIEIDVSIAYSIFNYTDLTHISRETLSILSVMDNTVQSLEFAVNVIMKTDAVKKLLMKPENYFDLILVEAHTAITYGFQHKFKAPLIAVSSLGVWSILESIYGNSMHPVLNPCLFSGIPPYSKAMTFWEKLDSVYVSTIEWLFFHYILSPRIDKLNKIYFGDDVPDSLTLIKNASMLFLNVNPIFSNSKPSAPNVIYFHNVHHSSTKEPISEDLQRILDNATEGIVYFSLGTNVRFDHLRKNFKETLIETLGTLPYTVLCKWESEDYPGLPKNIILRKWFPQQSILGHPNIKVFVSQGGLQSSEEAIISATPLVVIPFLVDQPMNAKILQSKGMAETVSPRELTKTKLREAIMKVAQSDKYRKRAAELRDIFLDQPQSGIEKIVWWCEYVIRHKGAKHLRSPAADIPLYEYLMLDILAFLAICFLMICIIIRLFLRLGFELINYFKMRSEKNKSE